MKLRAVTRSGGEGVLEQLKIDAKIKIKQPLRRREVNVKQNNRRRIVAYTQDSIKAGG